MKIRNFVRQYRNRAGLTIEDLADLSGVSYFTIRNQESNNVNMDLVTLYRLAKALDIDPFDLVDLTGKGIRESFDMKRVCKEEGIKLNDLLSTEEFKLKYQLAI